MAWRFRYVTHSEKRQRRREPIDSHSGEANVAAPEEPDLGCPSSLCFLEKKRAMKCMLPQPDVETNVADGGVIFAIGSSREHETNFRKNKVLHYELIYPSCGALKTSEWYLAISTCQTNCC